MEPGPRVILLASASPRRKELLEALGHVVLVHPVEVDERELPGETPDAYLARVVQAKLDAGRAVRIDRSFDALVVADTTVVVDAHILQKPEGADDGRRMLRALSGRAHLVTTRFAVAPPQRAAHVESVTTRVVFRGILDEEIETYVASGEGRDKAGGYGIQGRGASFIERIEGSYGAVVGLPSCEITLALHRVAKTSVRPPAPPAT
ncbi:MAG: Maf family protein [Polyangiales bacterium]